jgi:hypothetical protein
MVRPYVSQGVQIGVESTSGTAVPANKKLMAYKIDPQIAVETTEYRPSGYLVPTASAIVTEATEADFEGPIDFNNIVYPLSSLFGAATVSQPAAVPSPTVYEWQWNFTGKGLITPKTYSVEVGDSTRAVKFSFGAFSDMELSIERTGDSTVSGSMLGRSLTTAATLTATPTEVEMIPVHNDQWNVYSAATGAGLTAGTKFNNMYSVGLSFGDILATEYTLNSANSSFNSLYINEDPSFEWNMTLAADATSEGFLASMRAGTKSFIRLQALGPIIEDAFTYEITIDMCVTVTDFDQYDSEDGMYVLPISFSLAYDATWGKSMNILVRNNIAAL